MQSFISDKKGKLSKVAVEKLDGLSYSLLMKLLRKKDVKVNSKRVNCDVNIEVGDSVEIYYTPKQKEAYGVIYKDENVLVIDKKSGYTAEEIFTLLSQEFSEIYFIHRLDRNTSGIMIFALNRPAEKELLLGFKNKTFIKEYLAEVIGKMPCKEQILTAYLVKDAENSLVKIYDKKVPKAVQIKTGYKVIKTKENSSVLRVRLYTGKTHQIRAHLARENHAIIGDGKYGNSDINKKYNAKTQRLISKYLTLKFTKQSPLFYLDNKTFISNENLGEE